MIPDPDNPEQALDEQGRVNYAVRLYPVPKGPDYVQQPGYVIGWALPFCLRCRTQHPKEDPCSGSPGLS